jgi:hypothetical protein
LLSPVTNIHILTGLEKRYSDLRQHAEDLADDLEYVSAVAREAAEEREACLSQLEEQCNSLVVLLEQVVARTGTRMSREDQGVMERLERLEEQMGRFGEKLQRLWEQADIPPRLPVQEFMPRLSDMAQAATVLAASPSQAMERVASALSNGMNTNAPSLPSTPSMHEDAVLNEPTDDADAAMFEVLDAPVLNAAPVSFPTPAIPTTTGENEPTLPAANKTHAACTISLPPAQPAHDPTPEPIPGVNVVQPTPDNSQEAAQRLFNLIPLGAINAAGMRTHSRSRTHTPAPQEMDVGVPTAPTGGNDSPLPSKRPLEAEDGGSGPVEVLGADHFFFFEHFT